MLETGLIVSRFVHYTAVLVLFGASLFPLYAYPDRAGQQPARLGHWTHWILLGAAILALLSSLPWLAFTTANMVGTLSASADWDSVASVLGDTAFGREWLARLVLSSLIIVALVVLRRSSPRRGPVLIALLTASLLASLAAIGHTQQSEGAAGLMHVGADALHLLAAGAWIGGLLALTYVLAYVAEDSEPVLMRFSGMGYVAVAALVASGLVNSLYLVGSLDALVSTSYGRLLIVKLCVFAGMLGLAVTNRFWLVPALGREADVGKQRTLVRLRRHAVAEEVLGLLVILIASVLGTIEPAATQLAN
jgi:putative copper resistance protein D